MSKFSPLELRKRLYDNMTPSLHWNGKDNLDKHKRKCKNKLKKLLGWNTFKECESNLQILYTDTVNGYECIHFTVQTETDYYVNCHMLLPDNTKTKKPLLVGLQGHVSGAHISLGQAKYDYDEVYLAEQHSDFCIQAVKNGYVGLAIEQRAFGDNTGREEAGGTHCNYNATQALLLGRTLIGERVWDVKQVVKAVKKYFLNLITMKNSVLIGESGGGTATYYSACLLDDFDIYVPGVAVCSFKESIVNIEHCPCNYIPNIAKYFDMGDMASMIVPKKLIVESATNDRWFPIDGAKKAYYEIEKIYKARNAENNCVMVIGEGDHRSYPELVWEQIHKL